MAALFRSHAYTPALNVEEPWPALARLRGGLHFLISAAVAAVAAVLVFCVWYPGPFRLMAGGRDLFLLVTSVDVVIGPLLTFAVFNRAKG